MSFKSMLNISNGPTGSEDVERDDLTFDNIVTSRTYSCVYDQMSLIQNIYILSFKRPSSQISMLELIKIVLCLIFVLCLKLFGIEYQIKYDTYCT